jgi:hypothetical protein
MVVNRDGFRKTQGKKLGSGFRESFVRFRRSGDECEQIYESRARQRAFLAGWERI